ncbi:ABC transporter ATP-binding protein [Butyrivibrio fibrisolvens]|uniref:ABC transporter ATP-binding protein n=1 Tax=Butyrivibrio fibrisolvens TaxID=831 RepID=UPI00040EB5D1|nr:ABC transporter ATP-binding protein [Butyrivibrio fibrisolvens]
MAKKGNTNIETNTGKQTYSSRELIGRFLPYIKKYRGLLYLDLFFASLTTLCDIVLPMIMRRLTNSALGNSEALTVAILLKLVVLYVLLRLVDAGANFFMQSQGHIMGVYIETDMRRDAFEHLQRLSATYYSNHKIGQIMGRITNDLFDVTEFAHHCPEEFFIAGIKMVVSFIILSGSSLPLTLMIFACLPVMFVVSVKINHWLRQTQKAQRVQVGELNAAIEESLLGERIVKAFTGEEEEKRKFEEGNIRFQTIKKRFYYAMATFGTSTRMFDGLMYTVVILGGGLFLIHDMISAGDLVAYILYVSTLIATIRRIVEFAEQFQRGMTGIERFIEIMDTPIEIKDAEGAGDIKVTDGGISFKGVNFEYPDDHNKVLHDFNLNVSPGENLAIVGSSGGGKTTICNLIPRFYDVTKGHIDIDGQDISKVTLKSLRQSIGIVQQDVYLFSGTIRDNIAYGRPGASEREIEEAAVMAGANEFIDRLPNGMDTYIGERGVKLSGGQKQRISIARVFLKNPKILILDEATSALDNESELYVTHSLEKLAKGRTTITIAHRLTTVQNADRIIVLGKEGIMEEGTHESLLAKEGTYYKLWNRMAQLD